MITEKPIIKDHKNQDRLPLIVSGDEPLNNISKLYSKNWQLPFFLFIENWKTSGLFLVKRETPLTESIDNWLEWERS